MEIATIMNDCFKWEYRLFKIQWEMKHIDERYSKDFYLEEMQRNYNLEKSITKKFFFCLKIKKYKLIKYVLKTSFYYTQYRKTALAIWEEMTNA